MKATSASNDSEYPFLMFCSQSFAHFIALVMGHNNLDQD